MTTMSEAITNLRPGFEWYLVGDDPADIVFTTQGVAPVTKEDIDREIAAIDKKKEAAAATAAANAAAAIAHAKSLGFTDAMISAMYPGLAQ